MTKPVLAAEPRPAWAPMLARRLGVSSLGLGPRLTGAFLLVAVLALASGAVGLWSLSQANAAARLLDQSAGMIQAVQEVRVAFGALGEPPSTYLLTGDPGAAARFDGAVAAVRARLAEYAAAHSLHRHSTDYAQAAHALIAAANVDVDAVAALGHAVFAAQDRATAIAALAQLQARSASASARLGELLAEAQTESAAARLSYPAAQRLATAGISLSALLAVGLALGLAWYSTRRLTRPLAQLGQAADRIAAGDLLAPVAVDAPGELGQLAAAFERMRRMLVHERDRARRLAILEERDRIGREMHDGLAQVVGYVNTKAQAVREFLRAGQTETAGQQVEELIGAAREAYADARTAIADLRAEGVNERGLAELLEEQLERFRRQAGVVATLELAPDWPEAALAPGVRVQVLRIVQEALTNARKHAAAQHVHVSLALVEGQAHVVVADDGRGFHLSRLLSPDFQRYGLRTMRERAQAVGGTFRIESLPGAGTRISVLVPLESPDEAAG